MVPNLDWHHRYLIQARWTKPLREHLYRRLALEDRMKIIEVGCGTGVITAELSEQFPGQTTGIDIDYQAIRTASVYSSSSIFCVADGCWLPFPDNIFDLTVCHFFLLWVKEPILALAEMQRVTRPNGKIIALAEPDYGGRVDFPLEFENIAVLQEQSLQNQGVDTRMGRQLKALFHRIGLEQIETGVLGGQWINSPSQDEIESEWSVLQSDLNGSMSLNEFKRLKDLEVLSWKRGERILFVPTFYALGKKS